MTPNSQPIHTLPAGIIPGDFSTELFAAPKSRSVHFLQNAQVKKFTDLPIKLKKQLENWLFLDKPAQADLSGMKWSEALEEYAYCLFGSADASPDFCSSGNIQKPDNFRCSGNCRCLAWDKKKISYNEQNLTVRELQVIDKFKTGEPDKLIAHDLGIALPTLNNHKANIMRKMDATSKTDVVVKAATQKILQ